MYKTIVTIPLTEMDEEKNNITSQNIIIYL